MRFCAGTKRVHAGLANRETSAVAAISERYPADVARCAAEELFFAARVEAV
jgi:hypothetical protein